MKLNLDQLLSFAIRFKANMRNPRLVVRNIARRSATAGNRATAEDPT